MSSKKLTGTDYSDRFDAESKRCINITNNRLECLPESFDLMVYNKIRRKESFKVVEKRTTKYLYVEGDDGKDKLWAVAFYVGKDRALKLQTKSDEFWGNDISFSQGMGAYISLGKEIRNYLFDYGVEYGKLPAKKKHTMIRLHNKELWNQLPIAERFHAIDINNCWFQMAHRLGYLSEKIYTAWNRQDEYKKVLQRFLPMLSSPQKTFSYERGQLKSKNVDAMSKGYNILYNNVRAEASKIMFKAVEIVGEHNVIFANTDEIAILSPFRKDIADYFHSINLYAKLTLCQKQADNLYYYAGAIKNFQPKRLSHKEISIDI